jgi:hypothetical protein
LDYKDWNEVVDLFRGGFKYSELNINKVLSLKLGMNDKRSKFVWDHLNKFYNLD